MASLLPLLLFLIVCLAPPAHAYIDPTAGGFLLQALLAGTAGVAVVFRLYWKRVVAFFRKKAPPSAE